MQDDFEWWEPSEAPTESLPENFFYSRPEAPLSPPTASDIQLPFSSV